MIYSLSAIKTKVEGTTVKTAVEVIKDDLLYKKGGLDRQKKGMKGTGTLTAELNAAILKANSQRDYVNQLTDDDIKDEETFVLDKLNFDVSKLQKKSKMKGALALITTELEIEFINARIATVDALLPLIDARIEELPS